MNKLKTVLNIPYIEENIVNCYLLNKRYAQFCGNLENVYHFLKNHFIINADLHGNFDVEGIVEEIQCCLERFNSPFNVSIIDEKFKIIVFDRFGKNAFEKEYDNFLEYKNIYKDCEKYNLPGFEFVVKVEDSKRDKICNFITENISSIFIILLSNLSISKFSNNDFNSVEDLVTELQSSTHCSEKEKSYITLYLKTKNYKYLFALVKYGLVKEFNSNCY